MSMLATIFLAKIALTIVLWTIPPLLFPTSWLCMLGFPVVQPSIFLRLLGMAYFSLAVGYFLGWRSLQQGDYPFSTVLMGIVSNGGAFFLLAIAALQSVWKEWGDLARATMWASLMGTGLITFGLILFGPLKCAHMNKNLSQQQD